MVSPSYVIWPNAWVQCSVALISAAESDVIDSVSQMLPLYGMQLAAILKKPASRQQIGELLQNLQPVENSSRRQVVSPAHRADGVTKGSWPKGQFIAYFQPHIGASSQHVTGAEALVRWHHPRYGVLTPDYFLDELLEAGLASTLTQQVLEQSIRACRQWLDQGLNLTISVNITPMELMDTAPSRDPDESATALSPASPAALSGGNRNPVVPTSG